MASREESKRQQIIQKAKVLFLTQGYEKARVNQIISDLEIAKGTFYHYFSSKLDLLDAVISEMLGEIYLEMTEKIREEPGAVEKLNRFFRGIAEWKLQHIDFFKSIGDEIYDDHNTLFKKKLLAGFSEETIPILAEIFEEGKDEGVFQISDGRIAAEIVLDFLFSYGERINEAYSRYAREPEKLILRLVALNESINRILGAPAGTVELFQVSRVDEFAGGEVTR